MMSSRKSVAPPKQPIAPSVPDYDSVVSGVVELLEQARRASARAVNSFMTATYWEIGRRIVEYEQGGKERAEYGKELLKQLAADLTTRFGRGFSERSLERYRAFYLNWKIPPTALAKSETTPDLTVPAISTTVLTKSGLPVTGSSVSRVAAYFPLPWSHYLHLLSVKKPETRKFYETEALHKEPWIDHILGQRVYKEMFPKDHLEKYRAQIPCPKCDQVCAEMVMLWASGPLLGSTQDMDDVVDAVFKVHENRDKLASV